MKFSLLTFVLSCITLPLLYSMTLDEQLFNAASDGNLEQAQEALAAGANVNVKNSRDISALHAAVVTEISDMVKLLLESSAHADIQDSIGMTPLHYVAFNIDIIKLLLDSGANINAQDNEGDTLLSKVIWIHKTDTVKFLLDAGADVAAQDYFDWARRCNNRDILLILVEKCSRLLEQITLRPTKDLLTQAIDLGYVHAVKLLLKADIKPDIHDLALVKQKYNKDGRQLYKESYKTIGRMLLQHLRLTDELQAPEHSALVKFYRWIISLFWIDKSQKIDDLHGPISKSGLGLPKDVAHTIASFTY